MKTISIQGGFFVFTGERLEIRASYGVTFFPWNILFINIFDKLISKTLNILIHLDIFDRRLNDILYPKSAYSFV